LRIQGAFLPVRQADDLRQGFSRLDLPFQRFGQGFGPKSVTRVFRLVLILKPIGGLERFVFLAIQDDCAHVLTPKRVHHEGHE